MDTILLMSELMDEDFNTEVELAVMEIIPIKSMISLADTAVSACTYLSEDGLTRIDRRALFYMAPMCFLQLYHPNIKVDVDYAEAYDFIMNTNIGAFTESKAYAGFEKLIEYSCRMVEEKASLETIISKGIDEFMDKLVVLGDVVKENVDVPTLAQLLLGMMKNEK